jgi:hypothetical protein
MLFALALGSVLAAATWPIGISSNGRYFVNAEGKPYIMSFDTDHAIIALVPTSGYSTYLNNRKSYRFNGAVIFGISLRNSSSGAAFDGTLPFTVGTGPSTYDFGVNGANLNPAYWQEVSDFISEAAADGLAVALNPLPGQYFDCNAPSQSCTALGGAAPTLANNGETKVYQLGRALGTMFKDAPNLMWYLGDDCGNSTTEWCNLSLENDLVQGILSTDTSHLVSFESHYFGSYSNQVAARFAPQPLRTDLVYTYFETYDYMRTAYATKPIVPCFLGEANYEGGNNTNALTMPANQLIVRMENWWTMTSGCSGYMWGNESVNHNDSGYPASLDTLATSEVAYLPKLYDQLSWWELIPETGHEIVTAGYGTYNATNENLYTATFATTAWIPDGTLAVVYTPVATTLSVDMAKFAAPVVGRWYDPSNGTCTAAAASAFANTGSQNLSTPGKNHDGDPDWVLVLATTPTGPPALLCLSQNAGVAGAEMAIFGSNFGTSQGKSTVTFNGIAATPSKWNPNSIVTTVPAGAKSGSIVVTVGGVASNAIEFGVK